MKPSSLCQSSFAKLQAVIWQAQPEKSQNIALTILVRVGSASVMTEPQH